MLAVVNFTRQVYLFGIISVKSANILKILDCPVKLLKMIERPRRLYFRLTGRQKSGNSIGPAEPAFRAEDQKIVYYLLLGCCRKLLLQNVLQSWFLFFFFFYLVRLLVVAITSPAP